MIYEYGDQRRNDTDRRKPKNSEINLSQCHFVHHNSHMLLPWIFSLNLLFYYPARLSLSLSLSLELQRVNVWHVLFPSVNSKMPIESDLTVETIGETRHAVVGNPTATMKASRMYIELTNLFNGDVALGKLFGQCLASNGILVHTTPDNTPTQYYPS
jgi:hypothetical protein